MNKILPLVLSCLLGFAGLQAQNASDIVVPITVTTTASPASITLNFPATANATNTFVGRKLLNQTAWSFVQLAPNATSFTDANVIPGIGFEYMVVKQTSTAPTQRIGLVYAGIEVLATAYRGKMILVIDNALSAPLSAELDRLVQDLRGDGWQVLRRDIDVSAHTVPTVKALLRKLYDDDPDNTVSAFLIGNIPVPYSGNINPDGHPDHLGAWPTDYYYGDMDESAWTDSLVNNNGASRPANRNVPGDGKFDQSQTPTLPELVVSRLDFSNLSGWDVSQTELYRRYLNKNHNFRTGAYKPANQTLVDDNFGYFGGEAFAQNGWRNGNAITGAGSIVQGDFFADTDNQSFLIGYGCGGGNYTGASGVGSSANFQTDSVNIVFSMLFGSYFGDWDYETNPFMPSALASKGGILSCAWAGRPNWHFHHMGLGEPLATSTIWVWLNSFLANPVYPPNFGDDLIHVGLLGDPSLRAHAVRPPENLSAMASCDAVTLNWKASPDASLGYLIYRAPNPDSVFKLIVSAPVTGTAFTDTMPLAGDNFYQVKSFKLEMVPTGSYYNQSIGAPASANFNTNPISASAAPTDISCKGAADGAVDLSVSGGLTGNFTYAWSNGATTQNIDGLSAGTYTVTVTHPTGCTATASATVTEPSAIDPQPAANDISCFGLADGSIDLSPSGGTPSYSFAWSNGAGAQNISGLNAGAYTVTVTDAKGCTATVSATIIEPTALHPVATPEAALCHGGGGFVVVDIDGGTPGYSFAWSNNASTQNLDDVPAGTYTVTVTDANGCTATASATVDQPTAIETSTTVSNAGCAGATNGSVALDVSGGTPGYNFLWSNGTTEQNLSGVATGLYTVTIIDNNGCTATTSATVGQTTTLQASTTTVPVACFGGIGGSATAIASGGDPDYSYHWSNTETTATISNMPGGTFTVTVTDNAGCTASATAVITEPSKIVAGAQWKAITCSFSIGNVTLQVSGGTPGYSFLWSNGATTQNLDSVPPGPYTVVITDANGCTSTANYSIVQPSIPPVVSTAFAQTSCPGVTPVLGNLSSDVFGGTFSYSYLWSNGATTATQTGVPAGAYVLTVTDSEGCTAVDTTKVFQYFQPWQVQPVVTNASCHGGADGAISLSVSGGNGPNYLFQWSMGSTTKNVAGLPAGQYTVTITDESGCTTSTSVSVNQPAEISINFQIVHADCTNGYLGAINPGAGNPPSHVYKWSNGVASLANINLAPGTYTLTVTDPNGCTKLFKATVELIPFSPALPAILGPDTFCYFIPGVFTLPETYDQYFWSASGGGEVIQGQGTAEVQVSWSAVQTGPQTVQVAVTNGQGCQDSTQFAFFVDLCLSTQTPQLPGVIVQPNPFGAQVFVQFERAVKAGARLRLFDARGRLILENSTLTETTRLETGPLPAGSYILQIIEHGRLGVWKLVKY